MRSTVDLLGVKPLCSICLWSCRWFFTLAMRTCAKTLPGTVCKSFLLTRCPSSHPINNVKVGWMTWVKEFCLVWQNLLSLATQGVQWIGPCSHVHFSQLNGVVSDDSCPAFNRDCRMLVLDLGELSIETEKPKIGLAEGDDGTTAAVTMYILFNTVLLFSKFA